MDDEGLEGGGEPSSETAKKGSGACRRSAMGRAGSKTDKVDGDD